MIEDNDFSMHPRMHVKKARSFVLTAQEAYYYGLHLCFNISDTVNYAGLTWIYIGCPRSVVYNYGRIDNSGSLLWEVIISHQNILL